MVPQRSSPQPRPSYRYMPSKSSGSPPDSERLRERFTVNDGSADETAAGRQRFSASGVTSRLGRQSDASCNHEDAGSLWGPGISLIPWSGLSATRRGQRMQIASHHRGHPRRRGAVAKDVPARPRVAPGAIRAVRRSWGRQRALGACYSASSQTWPPRSALPIATGAVGPDGFALGVAINPPTLDNPRLGPRLPWRSSAPAA